MGSSNAGEQETDSARPFTSQYNPGRHRCRMAYVIAEPGIGVKDASCVDACQVDCIHPKKNTSYEDPRPGFDEVPQLYIDPVECIDCGACVPVCPVCQPFFR